MTPISLDWFRDPEGYRVERMEGSVDFLVGISDRAVPSKPIADNEMLYAEFAGLRTPGELLNFANKYGPPTGHPPIHYLALDESRSPPPRSGRGAHALWDSVVIPEHAEAKISRSPVQDHLRHAQLIRRVLESEHHGRKSSRKNAYKAVGEVLAWENALAYIQLHLREDGAGFQTSFVASSLLNAIWLQLAGRIGSGVGWGQCPLCGSWFEKGPGTDKRADLQFCRPSHKVAYHRKHGG